MPSIDELSDMPTNAGLAQLGHSRPSAGKCCNSLTARVAEDTEKTNREKEAERPRTIKEPESQDDRRRDRPIRFSSNLGG